jgi:hypothetical protein
LTQRTQCYDYLLTFSEELGLVWNRKNRKERSIPGTLFLITRYLAFVGNFMAIYGKRTLSWHLRIYVKFDQLQSGLKAYHQHYATSLYVQHFVSP